MFRVWEEEEMTLEKQAFNRRMIAGVIMIKCALVVYFYLSM